MTNGQQRGEFVAFNNQTTAHPSNNAQQLKYSAKVLGALKQFTGGLAADVHNPMMNKYGPAYQYLISGDAQRCRENIEDALVAYRRALDIRQDFAEAHVGVGKCLKRKGDYTGAIVAFKQALKQNYFDKETHLNLAKCYNESGNIKRSVLHYRRAVQIDPAFIEAKFGLALILELDGQFEEPTRLYEEIITVDEGFLPAYNNLGSIYLRKERFEEAEKTFRTLIKRAPDFGRAHLGLAITLDKTNRAAEAIHFYTKAMELKYGARNVDFVKNRIIKLNQQLGRSRTTSTQQTITRVK